MKKFYLLFLLIPFTFSFGQNLVQNGDFELWSDGVPNVWTSEEGTTITQETTLVTEGASSAKFHVNTGSQGTTDFRQTISVEIGRTYAVSVDVFQLDNTSKARIYAQSYGTYSDPTLVDQWQNITYEFTADADGDVEVGLRFYDVDGFDENVGSEIIIDNYVVECTDCDSTTTELFITSPAEDETFAIGTTAVTVEFTTNNFNIATPGNGDGHLHYSLDGGDAVMHYSNDSFTITDLQPGEHILNLSLVNDDHTPLDPEVTASVTFSIPNEFNVSSIADLRNGVQDGTIYTLTSEAVITMISNFRGQKWIQDDTAAILIDDNDEVITTEYDRYDGITGISGTVSEYNGVLQFIPTSDPGFASSTGNMIEPQEITAAELNSNIDEYESELVVIIGAYTDESGVWETGSNYNFMQSDVPEDTFVVRTNFYDADYIGTDLPDSFTTLVGIASEYNGTAQLFPRDQNDITPLAVYDVAIDASAIKVAVNNNILYVQGFNATKVLVYNVQGQVVSNSTFVGNLAAGTYIAVMQNEKGQKVNVKFMKK